MHNTQTLTHTLRRRRAHGGSSVDADMMRLVCSPCVTPVPAGPLSGAVRVPGSKSVSNRVLPLAVLGRGECRVRGLLHSDDTQRCMEASTPSVRRRRQFPPRRGSLSIRVYTWLTPPGA
jgi:hypothetical protein